MNAAEAALLTDAAEQSAVTDTLAIVAILVRRGLTTFDEFVAIKAEAAPVAMALTEAVAQAVADADADLDNFDASAAKEQIARLVRDFVRGPT